MPINKNKKFLIWTFLFTLIFSFIAPNFSHAEAPQVNVNQPYDVDLISKANPYVYLDQTSETFKLNYEGQKAFTANEIDQINKIINDTNSQVQQYRSDFIIQGNKFIPSQQTSGFTTLSIDKSKKFDYEFTWWGLRLYWSHDFVQILKNNLGIYGTGVAGFNLALITTLNYFKIPIPNWLTAFVGVAASVSVYAFIAQDLGKGVYLDCYMYIPTVWYPVKYEWITTNNNWYYYDDSGKMVTGWLYTDKRWYYLDPTSGIMKTGWLSYGGKYYYMNPSGDMKTGWLQYGGKWYYLKPGSGDMQTGWLLYGGKWYYMNSPNGDMKTGWLQYGGKWYYLDPTNGDMKTGWLSYGGKWYYLDPNSGAMVTGNVQINGTWYNFDSTGALVS